MEQTNVLFLLTPKNQVACLSESMNIRQALEKIRAHGYTEIPLLNKEGEYLGTISEGDLLWFMINQNISDFRELEEFKITGLLVKNHIPAIKVDASIDEMAQQIINYNFIPVVDDRNVLMGIVTRKKVLQELLKNEG